MHHNMRKKKARNGISKFLKKILHILQLIFEIFKVLKSIFEIFH